jgi:hypothetical protein
MISFIYRLGSDTRTLEISRAADGNGYECVVTDAQGVRIERFTSLPRLLGYEHELLTGWRRLGWREADGQSLRGRSAAPYAAIDRSSH